MADLHTKLFWFIAHYQLFSSLHKFIVVSEHISKYIQIPTSPIVTLEDTPALLQGFKILDHVFERHLLDIEIFLSITLDISYGSLLLKIDQTKVSHSEGKKQIALSGSVFALNSALRHITYAPPQNWHSSIDPHRDAYFLDEARINNTICDKATCDSLQIGLVTENQVLPIWSYLNLSIYVSSVDDNPIIWWETKLITMTEDKALVMGSLDVNISDADDDYVTLEISVNEEEIILVPKLKQIESLNVSSADASSKLTIYGEIQSINAALKIIALSPKHNFFGFSVLQLTVSDNINKVSKYSVINVLPVYDLPKLHIIQESIIAKTDVNIHLGNIEIEYVDCCLDDEDRLIFFANATFGKILMFRNSSIPVQFLHVYDNSSRHIMIQGNLNLLSLAVLDIYYQPKNEFVGSDVIHLKLIDRYEEIISRSINVIIQRSQPVFNFLVKNQTIFLEEDTKWINNQEIVQLGIPKEVLSSDLEEVHMMLINAQYGYLKFDALNGSHSEVSFFGNIHETREMIRHLAYIPSQNWTGVDNVTFHYALESVSVNFIVTPVNDAPVIMCSEPCNIDVFEQTNVPFPSLNVFDVDADDGVGDARGTGLFDLLILTSSGKVFSSNAYFLFYECNQVTLPIEYSESSNNFCFQGKMNDVNLFLSSLIYSPFINAKSDLIEIHISDNGNWDGGFMRSKMSSVIIHAEIKSRLNDQVDFSVSPQYYNINEDESFTFHPELRISLNSISDLTAILVLNTTYGSFNYSTGTLFGLKEALLPNGVVLEGRFTHILSFLENNGLTYFSRENFNGCDLINFKMTITRLTDAYIFMTESDIYVHVNAVNDYPLLMSPDILQGTQNTSIDLNSIMVDDADKNDAYGEVVTFFVTTKIGNFAYKSIYPGVLTSSNNSTQRIMLKGHIPKLIKYMKSKNIRFIPPSEWFGETHIFLFVSDSSGANSSFEVKVLIEPRRQEKRVNFTSDVITLLEDNSFSFGDHVATFKPFLGQEHIFYCDVFTSVGEVSGVITFKNDLATNRILYSDVLKLVYTPKKNFNGLAQIILECKNKESSAFLYNSYATIFLPLLFSPLNDPPSIKITKKIVSLIEGAEVKLEDEIGGIYIIDPDVHENNGTISVNITATHGTFHFPPSRSIHDDLFYWSFFENGLFLIGTVSTINLAIKEVKYKVPRQLIGNGSFTIFCSDNGNHGMENGATKALYDEKMIRFITVEQNDAPIINYDSIHSFITVEDNSLALKGIFSIADYDISDALTLTLEVGGENEDIVGGFCFGSNVTEIKNISVEEVKKIKSIGASPIFIIRGILAAVHQALDSIIFKPCLNWHGYLPNAINVTLSDLFDSTNAYFPLTVTSVNDAPSFVASKDSVYSKDIEILVSDYISVYIEDEDIVHYPNLKATMTVNVTTKFGGKLRFSKFVNGCYVVHPIDRNPSTNIIFRGTLDAINEALQNLVFLRYSNSDSLDIIMLEVNDEGNFGAGGYLSSTFNILIYLNDTNEVPLIP